MFSNEIVNQEVSCDCGKISCNADTSSLMRYNPTFEISRFETGEDENIYTIKNHFYIHSTFFSKRKELCIKIFKNHFQTLKMIFKNLIMHYVLE